MILFIFMGLSPQMGNEFKDETDISREFSEINRKLESLSIEVMTSTPTLSSLEKGQIVGVSTGTISIFMRVEDTLQYVLLTRWQ